MNTLKTVRLCIIVGMILTIAGCAGRLYVEPISGPTASIRFVASSLWTDNKKDKDYVWVYSIEKPKDGYCTLPRIGVLHGGTFSLESKKMGLPLSEGLNDKDFTEIIIPAGAFAFAMDSEHSESTYSKKTGILIHQQICKVSTEFEPAAGLLYEAEYILARGGCIVRVNELVKSADGMYVRQPEKTARIRPVRCVE